MTIFCNGPYTGAGGGGKEIKPRDLISLGNAKFFQLSFIDFLLACDFLKDEHCVSSTTVFPVPMGPKKRNGLYRSAKQTHHRGK